ncbi:protein disks lost [Drosophila innubila]|uniref:protein disks lost n=1 Tax=Drosophila innubila TaxID=198719 RepID=UPI00148B45A0|nr:protein disks lost [Drosophila innubila]
MQQAEEPEQQLQQLLQQLEALPREQLPQKLEAYFQEDKKNPSCSLENFAIYYLAALRQHTELHFRTSHSNESDTPKCQTPVRKTKATRTATATDLELNESQLSNLSIGNVSTPVRQVTSQHGRRSGNSQFCSTPQSSERSGNRSGGAGGAGAGLGAASGSSFCLGDFMLHTTPNQSQRSKKKLTPQAITPQDNNNKSQRPRRRVQPMTISKNVSSCTSFGDTSSFSNENNLLRLSQSCEIDRSLVATLEQEARKTLLLHKQEIKTEAAVASVEQQEREREREQDNEPNMLISLEHVSNPQQLQLLAAIYGYLMDLNVVPNVLSEVSYAMQLLNIRAPELESPESEQASPLSLLSRHKECVYFAVQLLEQQKELLLQLDRKSLTVLLQHERLSLLPKPLQEQLELICQRKQQQSKRESLSLPDPQQNVYYQHDKDSRDNFPTQHEFCCFKTQRDLFYKALKQWELSHLNRMFNFNVELGSCVREIFKQSEHAVNMSHFAKLFVSQLLMSSGETHESPEDLGLKLDQQRLNRLAQRLVTSNSSVEDQFPRTQAFFRDFISGCGSVAFLVQLQLALYVQLLRHNDSSFELLQLQEDEEQLAAPYVVRPQAMAELLMLAKFLGYVYALPYNRSPATFACPQQLQLRRQFQPPFEMRTHLERAMQQGKLLITLPWLVQYLTMLDLVTLQLPGSLATLELLFALYSDLANPPQPLHPCALFITRSCLGWLLESQPVLSSGYYSQRRTGKQSEATVVLVKDCLRSLCFADKGKAASMLEELLPVACPFLHEFRVSITPSQRQAQRNGRYRYITTRLEQLSSGGAAASAKSQPILEPGSQSPEQQQRKLTDAFLHSQNASMRRLLEFVTERSFKCVVKDAQQQILQPAKSSADALVNGISSTQQQEVLRELQRIYQQAWTQACQQWKEQVPAMLQERIKQSLRALLPENTNDVVRSTYAHLIRQQAQAQLQQWLQTSVLQSTFYQGDLQEVATKVCRSNKNNAQVASSAASSNEMCLTVAAAEMSLSELLHELQQWVHCLSLRPEHLRHMCDLLELLKRTRQAALLPQLPTYFYELLGSVLVRLLQLLICRQPQLLTETLINASCEVWLSPQLHPQETAPAFLDSLLSVSFVHELSMNLASFQLLQLLLNSMLDARVFSMDELNQLFMPLFKENWTPPVWNALSQLLQQVSQNRGNGDSNVEDDAKSHLFMEVLADLSRDLDSF